MKLTKLNPQNTATEKARYRILYVEDEDQNWEIAELSLRDKFSLERARNAREAFSMLAAGNQDCVLMDIQLSGSDLNGIEITQLLKGRFTGQRPDYAKVSENAATVPIIFVTAYNARYSRAELLAAGGDELIPKPVDFTRLSLAVSRLLVRRAMR